MEKQKVRMVLEMELEKDGALSYNDVCEFVARLGLSLNGASPVDNINIKNARTCNFKCLEV